MQTTLRIDDQLYKEAKAEAAREGTTLTRFLEEGLRLRLKQGSPKPAAHHSFRVHDPGASKILPDAEIRRAAMEAQEAHDFMKLGNSEQKRS